jgi:hypothetical protein
VTGLVSGLLGLPGVAVALPHTFTKIADISGPFGGFDGRPGQLCRSPPTSTPEGAGS